MGKVGKRTKKSLEAFSGKSNVTIEEAVKLVKSNATAKFDETIEIAMNLGVDTRHADQMVRGVVGLPNGTGKSMRVAVFARDTKAQEANVSVFYASILIARRPRAAIPRRCRICSAKSISTTLFDTSIHRFRLNSPIECFSLLDHSHYSKPLIVPRNNPPNRAGWIR